MPPPPHKHSTTQHQKHKNIIHITPKQRAIYSKKIFNSASRIQILENIRFFKGEKDNSDELGSILGSLGHIYVFDAFGTAHREKASTHSAIENSNNACAGILLEKENEFL